MKAAHRHELETNALAQRLEVAIERLRPYVSSIIGVVAAVVILLIVWSYVSRSSVSRQSQAWNTFHEVVTATRPNLDQLRQTAQEFPGSQMQELADLTWADGQVLSASVNYVYNRATAMQELDRATSAYQSILQTSDDARLVNRARLGLARVYEMRGELDRARDEYLKVGGGYAEFAKAQAERLANPKAKETMEWLAKAEPPRPRAPAGAGSPGQQPEFSAVDIPLPSATQVPAAPGTAPGQTDSFEELIKGLGLEEETSKADDRYGSGEAAPPETETEAPASNDQTPPQAPPVEEAPATEEKPAE